MAANRQQASSDDQGALTQEKLIEKYKSALGIAQKAKNARDEALKNSKLLQNENEQLKEKVVALEKQYKTAEEMLAALTDQKLKLAMEIDDLKKEKKIYFEELKSKENIEKEAENYKSQYKKLLKDNEELISSAEGTISKMKKDHEELKRQNDTLKQLCNNIQIEKNELDKSLNINMKRLSQFEEDQNALNSALSKKYNIAVNEFKNWVKIIDSKEDSFGQIQLLQMENEALKSEKDRFNSCIKTLTKDKENMEQEIIELNERIKKICSELDAVNADRDKMLNNLEKVSLETKRLIENSEALTKELGNLKEERASMEHLIASSNIEKVSLNRLLEEKELLIQELMTELRKSQLEESESGKGNRKSSMNLDKDDPNRLKSDFVKEESFEKERSVNVELNFLQEDLQAFSSEIERYKVIVKESETKLYKALETISEKNDFIACQESQIEELKSKVSQLECLQAIVADSLSETSAQLKVALEELGVIERLKENLEYECKLKDEEFLVACHKLQGKEGFIKDIVEGIEGLRADINRIHEIDSLDEEFDTDSLNPQEYITGLRKCFDAVTSKMNQKYKEEIDTLKEIINEYQESNEALTVDNNKLSKQAKDLLNEQANYDNSLVLKLKTFKENLLQQLKEKQSVITKLENEVALLKEEISKNVNRIKVLENEKSDLQCQYEGLLSDNAAEIKNLFGKCSQLEIQFEECLSVSNEKTETIKKLEDQINELKNAISGLENASKNEKSDLKCQYEGLLSDNAAEIKNLFGKCSQLEIQFEECLSVSNEKTETINKLEGQINELKNAISGLENASKNEKSDLKCQYEGLLSDNAAEIKTLFEKCSQLEIQFEDCLSVSNEKTETINKLEGQINELKNAISDLENNSLIFKQENKELNDAIIYFDSELEKENEQLKKLFLNFNSELADNMKEIVIENSVIKKFYSSLKTFQLLRSNFSKELERLRISGYNEKEKLECDLSKINEEKERLSNELTVLSRDMEQLRIASSNVKEGVLALVNLCRKEEIFFKSDEINRISELFPTDLKDKLSTIKILENNLLESEVNIKKEELIGKVLHLETMLRNKEDFTKEELGKKDLLISHLEEEVHSLKDRFTHVSALNDSLNTDLSNFKDNLERLRCEYNVEKDTLLERNRKLENELKDCKELLDFKSLELRENNRIWAGRFSSLKVALLGLNRTRKDIRNQFGSIESSFNTFINEIREPLQEKVDLVVQSAVAAAKAELIREMHQMNQALKERGETISKLEFTVTDCHSKLKQVTAVSEGLQSELVSAKTELRQFGDLLKEKDQLIKQLEAEIDQLKESAAPDNDVLSTSTISKTEEHSRLKDVEDSFEDRYTKLKMIAVKLKKRAAELAQTLESERAKAVAERTELQEKIASMSMAVKNAQKIQELFDESLDERDKLKKENILLKNTVEELRNNEVNLNSKISSLESSNQSIPVMKKHIDSLNGAIKESKSEMQRLQMEMKAETIKYEEAKKNGTKLEGTVQELTRQLEQAKLQGKSNNVLELEMKNYEKIIADLSSQLNVERASIKSLKSENEASANVKIGLEEQISILEKQISVEEERIKDSQDQVAIYQTKLEDKKTQIVSLNTSLTEMKKLLSEEQNRNEALTLEMSTVTSEFSKKEIAMSSKISSLQDQIRSLETSLQSTKQELATSKREIDHLNEEYESYKLRAQTILAKKKGDLITHGEKEAKEECERLKREWAAMESRLDACMSEMDTLNTRISSLNLEKVRSDKRYEEVRSALQQKVAEYDILNTEFYNLKITNEIAIEQLKAELAKKKSEYQAELSHHKKVIDDLVLEFKQKEEEAITKDVLNTFPENILPSTEREDGEGSESVPSPKARRHSIVVPLDVLLNSPDESKVSVLQEQVEKLQKDLGSSEVRARHLASLLSEAEKDSARNLHQNKVLKEEVRRLERALERQPHVANTEYLKNVVFKFVTLPSGDERSRLVPVLDTLLKFSPEETHKLSSVAKGDSEAGWGSYLQSWTGL